MKKQAGPFNRIRTARNGYSSQSTYNQQPTQTNFNPVQSQMSSMSNGYQTNTNNLPYTTPPMSVNTGTQTTYQNPTQQRVNLANNTQPNGTNVQQPTQAPSQFYQNSVRDINNITDFEKYPPSVILLNIGNAQRQGQITPDQARELSKQYNARYREWRGFGQGDATQPQTAASTQTASSQPRPTTTPQTNIGNPTTPKNTTVQSKQITFPNATTQPVVRNQQNTIDTKIDNLGSNIDAFANEDAWDTQPLAPNSLDPMYAGPGAAIFNNEIPVEIPVPDENGGGMVHNTYLEPDQFAIYQQNMADEFVARKRDEWNRNRIRTGGKPPKPMKSIQDKERDEYEAYSKRIQNLNAEYQAELAETQRKAQEVMLARENMANAAEYANNSPMPMSGPRPDEQQRNQEKREQQILQKQKQLSGRLSRLGGRKYRYVGGNATPEQLSERENEARNWLMANPNHPNARFVRQLIRELDQIRGGQSPQIARR